MSGTIFLWQSSCQATRGDSMKWLCPAGCGFIFNRVVSISSSNSRQASKKSNFLKCQNIPLSFEDLKGGTSESVMILCWFID